MSEPIRHELHDAERGVKSVIETEAAGIAVAHRVMYRTPDGPWIQACHGGDEEPSEAGRSECVVPALPRKSIIRALFIAAGRQEGDRFRVEFRLEQGGRVLRDPDKPFVETLQLGEGARKEWAWRYVLE